MARRNRNSTSNPTIRTFKILSLITILLVLIIGSQEFLNSYPVDILITNDTVFANSFTNISNTEIIISANQIPLNNGDVITLKTGGYIKITHVNGNTEAYKYNKYKFHQNILFTQTLYKWNTLNPISLETGDQIITLTKLPSTILVETPLSRYELLLSDNSFTFITSDDGNFLYKLSQSNNIITITAIGLYNNIPFNISEYKQA